jgi:hypothetical protein
MGLDMYLYKAVYVGSNYDFNNISGTIELYKDSKKLDIHSKSIIYILEDFAYWRKANHIHKWFVDKVQDGVDNCAMYYVPGCKLLELLDLCKQVKENHNLAEELLPTQSGFFFGDTAYDEYYFDEIDITIKRLKDVKEEDEFYYSSSW